VSQTVNEVTTDFTLDLAEGLTQVLQDGTNSYVYGNGRIAQESGTTTEYFLGDALGSVRNLVDEDGVITLTQEYEPYGEILSSDGTGTSDYAFTGESFDAQTGLVYLRSRMYSPQIAIFTSKDTWKGNQKYPISYNSWLYGNANPIYYIDPSGHIAQGQEDKDADAIIRRLSIEYDVHINKDWGYVNLNRNIPGVAGSCIWNPGFWHSIDELKIVQDAIDTIAIKIGKNKFRSAMASVKIIRSNITWITGMAPPEPLPGVFGNIILTDYAFPDPNSNIFQSNVYQKYGVIHEFGHVWDYRSNYNLSKNMKYKLGTWVCSDSASNYGKCTFDISAGKEPPPGDKDLKINYAGIAPTEDWAEAFANYIYPDYYLQVLNYNTLGSIRRKYVEDQINAIP